MNAESLKPSESAIDCMARYSSPVSNVTTRMEWSAICGLFGKLAFKLKLDRFEPPSRDAATHPPVAYGGLACAELLSQGTDTADQLNGFFEGLYFIHALIITFVLVNVNTFGLLG